MPSKVYSAHTHSLRSGHKFGLMKTKCHHFIHLKNEKKKKRQNLLQFQERLACGWKKALHSCDYPLNSNLGKHKKDRNVDAVFLSCVFSHRTWSYVCGLKS